MTMSSPRKSRIKGKGGPAPASASNVRLHVLAAPGTISTHLLQPVISYPITEYPQWAQYGAISSFLEHNKLTSKDYYGFLPQEIQSQTGLSVAELQAVKIPGTADIFSVCPLSGADAHSINPLVRIDQNRPGFLAMANAFAAQLGLSLPLDRALTDSRTAILGTLFVARSNFWRLWLAAFRKLVEFTENSIGYHTEDGGRTSLGLLLAECIPTLLLLIHRDLQVTVHDPFRHLRSDPAGANAIIADALKTAALSRNHAEYVAVHALMSGKPPSLLPAKQLGDKPSAPASPIPTTSDLPVMLSRNPPSLANIPQPSITPQKAMTLVELISEGERLGQASRPDDAIRLYQTWLEQNTSPQAFVAHFNLGHMLSNRGDVQGAIANYELALQQHPRFLQALLNLGSMYERLGRKEEAITEWQKALEVQNADPNADISLTLHALNNTGRVLEDLRRYPDAEAALKRSLMLKPDQEDVIHHWVHLRQKQCEWPIYSPLPGMTVESMKYATSALATLSASNDPEQQLAVALKFAREKVSQDKPLLSDGKGYAHDRLRIGYLSSNFGMHAVSLLTAELYELHDRKRVEVWGFCWSPEDNTPMRARIKQAMDHFVRIDQMSDETAAQAIRAAEIDILIDLQGLTSGARPNIISQRPAPVQITYLGFPGTTGLPGIDYVLADRYIIPEEEVRYFSEKPLYLPDCFQVNDRQRASGPVPARSHYGLSDDAFVFCAFNHNHKFTPELFNIWMSILHRTPGSVLWLLADNDRAHDNLMRCAAQHEVAGDRLIFAPRVAPTEYLARFQLADLFLDTFPFNGGTTASDALWMGLPLLTCSGRTFASRMAGSLLHTLGVPELITTNFSDYEERAVELAGNRTQLAAIRKRLEANRNTSPLFDTPRFVRALEDVLERVAHRP